MEAEQLMKSLKKKRGIVKGHLTRFIKFLDNFDGNAVTQLQARYNKFELIYKEFNEIQTEIELGDTIDDDEREDFENNYFQYMAVAENFIKEHTVTKVNDANLNDTAMSKYAMNIKLPTLKLPTFDGAYDQWLLYFDTFTSIVDSNESISPIQKFQYLRSSLTGDALQIISCLEISTSNYDLAWDLLKKRYKNTRLIVHNHMKSLFEIESCQKDSHSSIRILVDNLQKHTRALESLKQPVGTWDTILIYLITQKLDIGTHKEWEELVSKKDTELMPTMEEFINFLIQRAQVLEVLNRTSKSVTEKPKVQHSTIGKGKLSRTGGSTTSFVTTDKKCTMCNHDSHQLFACDKFLKLSIPDRINHIRQAKLCFNCLLSNHVTKDCVSGSCRVCQKKHNSLLHLSDPIKSSDQSEPISKKDEVTTTSTCHSATPGQTVAILLSTAVVKVCGADGTEKQLRVLLDSGSQSHFITKHACELLNLKPTRTTTTVTGISDSVTSTHQQVNVTIQSRITSFKATLNFLVMPKITGNLPLVNVSLLQLNLPHNIQLADPTFHQSSPVDMLIGAEIFFELLCIGQFKPTVHSPTFQKTKLGWIVTGKITSEDHPNRTVCHFSRSTIDEKIAKFWEIEEIETNKRSQSTEDMKCEEHFRDTFGRNTEGRFTVSLPFNSHITQLGNSKAIALQRFKTLERKLQRNTDLHIQYSNFMQEYEQLGHMTAIPDLDEETNTCYLPHHAVLKEDSSTTRLRVVFDASAKTTSGRSLNDTLLKGPTIQDDLIDILLRFRKHNIVLTADITKMYRQINIDPQDANRQLIFWRNHPNKPLQTYKLNTVTYGTTSAPFLAVRCLEQLAIEEQPDFPEASRVLRNDFYVDDLLSGSDTYEHAEKIMHELLHLLKRGCFDLRKWRSNIPELLTHLSDNQIDKTILTIEKEVAVKTLGLLWNSHSDCLMFSVGQANQSAPITKRRILSFIAQIFDPLGILGPVITTAKIIMQQLWELKLGWDELIPERLHTSWINYQSQLVYLNQLHVPRKMTTHSSYTTLEIHEFFDASQPAYGAIFICMVTKAVHIELVSTLSTEGFLNELKRFISRRGKHAHMFSDNGTNFRGASNKLKELFSTSEHQNKIVNTLAEDRINWHFIPARAPHFGGIWEAAVKSLKHHIRRVAGEASLTFEQLYTLIVQIEACLNSRPICSLSNDPNDLSFLTPGHFLIGDSLTAIAEPDITSLNVGRLSQWQHVQQLQQHFWSRWHKEYISELQQRRKWKSQMDPILKAGYLVIIREDNIPPLQWHVGRVELVHPGHDGIVRAATVRTTSGSYKRPVVRLCLLPILDNYS